MQFCNALADLRGILLDMRVWFCHDDCGGKEMNLEITRTMFGR